MKAPALTHSDTRNLRVQENSPARKSRRDKKGRPRQRDCRPYLLDLHLAPLDGQSRAGQGQVLDLEAAVDPQGRSLRPEHLRHWLSASLGQPLALGPVQRRCLRLDAC